MGDRPQQHAVPFGTLTPGAAVPQATLELPVPYLHGFSFGRTDRTVYVTASDSKDPSAPGKLYEVRL